VETDRIFPIALWISLPTVMYGGYALLRFITAGKKLSAFQLTFFRAGHAHAGVLLVTGLVYYDYLGRTALPSGMKQLGTALLGVGILAQSGGFFLHMMIGQEGKRSAGTTLTTVGALCLATAMLLVAYGLMRV
jgi:hypothetical protein